MECLYTQPAKGLTCTSYLFKLYKQSLYIKSNNSAPIGANCHSTCNELCWPFQWDIDHCNLSHVIRMFAHAHIRDY